MIRMFLTSLLVLVSVVATSVAYASDEAVEVQVTPVTIQDLNFQYGDTQFAWHRIHTDEWQVETNNAGDIRLGARGELGTIGEVGVHGRLLAKLSGTDLTEIRPEVMLYKGNWYTFVSVGVDTETGTASLYDETVVDLVSDKNWKAGLGLVHNGGLSGQKSTINLGPHFNVQLADRLNLDLHYGWAVTKNTSDEAWAIMSFKVQ